MATRALTASVVAAALVPWAALLPLPGALGVLAQALAFVAALHGAGSIASRFAGGAVITLQYGLAALIGIAGIAQLLGHATLGVQSVVLYTLVAIHTATLAARRRAYVAALERAFATRWWLVPTLMLLAVGALHVLGAAGAAGARPFDDDGHVLAQIQRLRDTGELGDAIGYARASQLGGQVALASFVTVGGDVQLVRMLEAIAFVLALGLALARMQIADARGALWGLVVVVAASALAWVPAEPIACWTIVGIVIALVHQLDDEPDAILVGMLAGGLVVLRLELVSLAIVAVVALAAAQAVPSQRGAHATRRLAVIATWARAVSSRRTLVALAGALAVALAHLIARTVAAGELASDVIAQLVPTKPLGGRLAIFAGVAVLAIPIGLVVRRGRWLAIGCVLVVAVITGELFGARSYGFRMLWPLVLASALCLASALARRHVMTASMMIASLVAATIIYEGRAATGRVRWTRRYLDLAANIEYLRQAGREPPGVASPHDALLALVEPGATVAIWVASPERIDYDVPARIVDLRTPRLVTLRTHSWDIEDRATRLLHALGVRYLLFDRDDRWRARTHEDPVYHFACGLFELERCADDLERVVARGVVVGEQAGAVLVRIE